MKYLLPSLLFLFTVGSCQNPCEKVHQKTVECARGAGLKKSLEEQKDTIVKLCSPFKDKVEECLGYEKCGDFNLCMKKNTKNLIGKTKKSQQELDQERNAKTDKTPPSPSKSNVPTPTRDITKKEKED